MAEALLDYKPEIKGKMLGKALNCAARRKGFTVVVQGLLSMYEVDINFAGSSQYTALMFAAENGRDDVRNNTHFISSFSFSFSLPSYATHFSYNHRWCICY